MKKTLSFILAAIMVFSVFTVAVSAGNEIPDKVVVKSVKNSNGGLLVEWEPVKDAVTYYIYRYDSLDPEPAPIASTTSTKYLDKHDLEFNEETPVVYYYAIAAVLLVDVNEEDKENEENKENVENKKEVFVNYVFADKDNFCEYVCAHKNAETVIIPASVYTPGQTYKVCRDCGHKFDVKITKQLAPATPKISGLQNTANGISFKWNLVDGATSYLVYRKTGKGAWTIIAKTTDSKYLDRTVKSGTSYQYTVRGINAENNYVYSKFVSGATSATLEWALTKNCSNYYIVRESAGEVKFVGQVSAKDAKLSDKLGVKSLTFKDKGLKEDKSYQYYVCAAVFSGYKATGTLEFLSTPKDLKAANADSGVVFTWEGIKGAKSYRVYRQAAGEEGYTFIGNGSAYKTKDSKGKEITRYRYVDKTAESGIDYKYTVKAVDGKSYSSYKKDGVAIRRLDTPKLVKIVNSKQGITVSWTKVKGAAGYRVYRKTADGWKHIGTVTNLKSSAYLVRDDHAGGLTNGKVNTYTVRAYYDEYTSAYNKTGIKLLRLQEPELDGVKSTKSGVYVKWDTVTAAKGYYVYAKTGNGNWKRVGTVSGQAKNSFVDKSAKKGTTYFYTVKAYNGNVVSSYDKVGLEIKDIY